MAAQTTGDMRDAGSGPCKAATDGGGGVKSALHSALEVALLPARLAGRVWEAGRGALASIESLTPGKLAGAAWGAAAEGAEVRPAASSIAAVSGVRSLAAAASAAALQRSR